MACGLLYLFPPPHMPSWLAKARKLKRTFVRSLIASLQMWVKIHQVNMLSVMKEAEGEGAISSLLGALSTT